MAHITGHIRIAAPVGRVFDTVADTRNEPSFNPAMTGVELLTPPPVGLGTRFRARIGRAGMEMLVELTGSPRQVWRPLCLRTACKFSRFLHFIEEFLELFRRNITAI